MIRQSLADWIEQALQEAKASGVLEWETVPTIEVDPPRNKAFGDYATNVAMLLAKQVRMAPHEVAKRLIEHLPAESHAWFDRAEIAGGGFVNFHLKPGWAGEIVRHILQQGDQYGSSNVGQGKRVLLEFVSANPTGPLSVAHGRGAVLGDTLANVFNAAGYRADREFYINDATNSTQIRNFAHSVVLRSRQLLGEEVQLPEDAYQGGYVSEIAATILRQHGADALQGDPAEVLSRFEGWSKALILQEQQQDLRDFGVIFDRWFSEQTLHDANEIQQGLERIRQGGYTYESEGALWLRSTAFGDDKDRPLVRANGLPTYIAADVAYHWDKYQRGYEWLINILGPDHHGYIARMKAVAGALGYNPDTLTILIHQVVRLYKEGSQVRMSKRTGNLVTLREVLDEAGKDATRFFYLMRSHESPLDFDLDLAERQSDENPVYYVQYAHARMCNILRVAAERGVSIPTLDETDLSLLTHDAEESLIKRLADLPDEVRLITVQFTPHRLTTYALDVARAFHLFYTHCRVLGAESAELMKARLLLVEASRLVLVNTLRLLGVTAPAWMEKLTKPEVDGDAETITSFGTSEP